MNVGAQVPIVSATQGADTVVKLQNGGEYSRYRGIIIGAPASIVPGHECQIDLIAQPPPALVATFKDASVFGRCIIMTRKEHLIRESLINTNTTLGPFSRANDETATLSSERAVTEFRSERPLVLLKQEWDQNYGHWLIESLPRIGMISETHDIKDCQFIIGAESGPIGKVYRDTLSYLGVKEDSILPLNDGCYKFDTLVYPTPITVQPWIKAPRVISFLEKLGSTVLPKDRGPRKIYVTRNASEKRRLRNEDQILSIVLANGYTVVNPGAIEFAKQVQMFRDATHVIGILGAGLSNIAFSARGIHLLALTSEYMQNDFFWDLICQKNGTYTSLHGKAVDLSAGMQSSFDIDQVEFLKLFQDFDARPSHV